MIFIIAETYNFVKLIHCCKVKRIGIYILQILSEGRGHWALYYTSPQSLIITFSIRQLNNLEDYYSILIGWFIQFSVKKFQPLIVIYRMGNFVYHHLGCTSILSAIVLSLQIPGMYVHVSVTQKTCTLSVMCDKLNFHQHHKKLEHFFYFTRRFL